LALSCNTNGKPDSIFSLQERRNHDIDENSHGENFKWDEVHRTLIILLLILAGTVRGSQEMALQRAVIDRRMRF
jgi:hypothetical protein